MPASLRIPPKREGMTKTAFILDAIDEKLGLAANSEQLIRKAAGWLTPKKTSELRENLQVFEEIHEGDWNEVCPRYEHLR